MNNWKDVSHLFANGKFKVKYTDCFGETSEQIFDGLGLELLDGDTTLIARKIEDMTDEEIISFFDAWNYRDDVDIPQLRKDIMFLIEDGISFERALNLLSIGVYPFSQSHFGEIVIDMKTI